MAHYHQHDYNAMRQEALRRSREMQQRSAPPTSPAVPLNEGGADLPPRHTCGQNGSTSSGQPAFPQELQGLFRDWDGEKIALLALLYLLYREGTDAKLLLAIAYILL